MPSWEFHHLCVSIKNRGVDEGVEDMAKINGIVKSKQGQLLENAEILFVDRSFEVLTSGYSNDQGEYYLQVNERTNGMVMATYAYGEEYLAFTFANLNSGTPHRVDITLGDIEFIHFTRIINRDSKKFTYEFQLASLEKMKNNSTNISPDDAQNNFKLTLGEDELLDFELEKRAVLVGENQQWIDQYTLSFHADKSYRGKILRIAYLKKEAYGTIKTIL